MESHRVVVFADRQPMSGMAEPGTHQVYRHPRVSVEKCEMGELGTDAIRVAMLYGGLCGTDVHLLESDPQTGYVRCSAPVLIGPAGRVIGHEAVGRILAVGSGVKHLEVGQVVTFESIIVCHHCEECRRGQFNQCRHAKLLGLESDGLFGTIVDVPAKLAHDVTAFATDDRALRAAACVEPAAVAYVACQNIRVTGGDVVVVFGAGPIGVFAAMLCKGVFGAARVHLVEPVPFRRNFASRWADETHDVEGFFHHPPPAINAVIETSGVTGNVTRVFRHLGANGRVALLARNGESLLLNDVDHMITNAILVTGSRGHLCGAFTTILNLCRRGRLDLEGIVTDVVDAPEGLCELLRSPQRIVTDNCKVLARFRGVEDGINI